MSDYVLPKLQESERVKCDIICTMTVGTSGQSLRTLENPFLRAMFKILRPDNTLPDRHDVAGKLLDGVIYAPKVG